MGTYPVLRDVLSSPVVADAPKVAIQFAGENSKWVRNSRVLVATLPRSSIPTTANKTALYAPVVVLFSQPAGSSGGLLNGEISGPKFEPLGANIQPSSEGRFISP